MRLVSQKFQQLYIGKFPPRVHRELNRTQPSSPIPFPRWQKFFLFHFYILFYFGNLIREAWGKMSNKMPKKRQRGCCERNPVETPQRLNDWDIRYWNSEFKKQLCCYKEMKDLWNIFREQIIIKTIPEVWKTQINFWKPREGDFSDNHGGITGLECSLPQQTTRKQDKSCETTLFR